MKLKSRKECHPCGVHAIEGARGSTEIKVDCSFRTPLFHVVQCDCGDYAVVLNMMNHKPTDETIRDMITALRYFVKVGSPNLQQDNCSYWHIHAHAEHK